MHTLATCRHELWRHSYARLLPPLPPGGVVVVGVLDGNSPLHDKDSFPPLHSLCKVKQFYCNRGGGVSPPPWAWLPPTAELNLIWEACGCCWIREIDLDFLSTIFSLSFSSSPCKRGGGGWGGEFGMMGWVKSISMKSGAGGKFFLFFFFLYWKMKKKELLR